MSNSNGNLTNLGQTFRPSSSARLSTISIYLDMVYVSGTMNLQLYSCPNANTWGTLLATKSNVPLSNAGWNNIDVSSLGINVTGGQLYGFRLVANTGLSAELMGNYFYYNNGDAWFDLGGGTYVAEPDLDMNFKVTGTTPLPARLGAFTAQAANGSALLKWTTLQEQNTRDFILQHSTNGSNWTDIGTVTAAGNSNNTRSYSYLHATPAQGGNYYRILQRDLDNRYSYSEIRTINFEADKSFEVLGNPVRGGQLQVKAATSAIFSLHSAAGKMLWSRLLHAGTQTIAVEGLAKGIYYLRAGARSEKIVIQ